jgi:hypothetical protein
MFKIPSEYVGEEDTFEDSEEKERMIGQYKEKERA